MLVGLAATRHLPILRPGYVRQRVRRGCARARERAMTIAAGFVCSDGVVLAADTQWSGPTKRYHAKLWHFPAGAGVVAVAAAGDGIAITRWTHDFQNLVHRSAPTTTAEILGDADETIYPLWYKLLKDDPDAHLSLLLAVRVGRDVALFENQNQKLFAPVASYSQCIGCGATLGLYLADWLFDIDVPMVRARIIAAYLLKQVKQYDDDCGGESQILMFPRDGEPHYLPEHDIAALEGQQEYFKYATKRILASGPGIIGLDMNEETKERRDAATDKTVSVMGALRHAGDGPHLAERLPDRVQDF